VVMLADNDAVGLAVDAMYDLIARPSVLLMCTDGTKWKSASSSCASVTLLRIMPTPPASFTARLLSTRALVPRLQSTIFPVTFAGSSVPEKQSSGWPAGAPARPAFTESMSGDEGTAEPRPTPVYELPFPSVTVVLYARSKVPAASVVSHGSALS